MRKPEEVQHAKRSAARSLFRSYVTDPPPRAAGMFRGRAIWEWVKHYVSVAFTPRRPFRVYQTSLANRPGRFRLAHDARVALVSDWGTGTPSAYRVMDQVRNVQRPDVTIHLGDIYYSGTIEEVESYFLGQDDWYRAPEGSWALNANHEMYSGGEGYFDRVLPAFDQPASYFCLENLDWRIVALDTGYHAKMFPLLELLVSQRLLKHPDAVLRWLRDVIFADPEDRRSVLLLSHHQWFSAWDKEYRKIGNSMAEWLDRVLIWFWGHEHRLAGYAPWGHRDRPRVRARCLGHGGMPIEPAGAPKRERGLVFWDDRSNPANTLDGDPIGYNGNVLLNFDGPVMRIEYFDETGELLLEERWERDPATGEAAGEVLYARPGLSLAAGREIEALVE